MVHIYYLIINTITMYNQIKNSDIFIADSGNHYCPDIDLETDINTDINTDLNTDINTDLNTDINTDLETYLDTYLETNLETDVNTYNDMEFNKYKNCILCKLIGLDLRLNYRY